MKTKDLYPFQTRVGDFVADKPRVGIFTFFGSGKTYMSLKWLSEREAALPALVLTLKSVVDSLQWAEETEKHTDYNCCLVTGSAEKRVDVLNTPADIYVINYDAVRSAPVLRALHQKSFQIIVADESTMLKESRTLRFKLLRKLTRAIPHRALLTGKPILERPEEIWSQMLFLDDGDTFGKSFWRFRDTYFHPGPPWQPYDWTLKVGASQAIAERLNRLCIRVPKEEIEAELPPKRYITVHFDLPDDANKLYKELKSEFRAELPSGEVFDTMWAMVKAQKLHQICQGVFYTGDGYELLHDKKLQWLTENVPLMLSQGPILIWTHFVRCIELIQAALASAGISSSTFHGQLKTSDRAVELNKFNQGEVNVLILGEKAGHAGLNLQRANQAIFFSTGYSAGERENAEDRCHRLGSEMHKSVTYYDLVAKGKMDEVVLKAIKGKKDMAEAILKHIREE